MPCSYVIDHERQLVISTGTGILTAAEVLEHQQALAADDNFNPDFNQLLDFSSITKIDIDSNWVRLLAQRTLFSHRSRRAFLVNSMLAIGLSRMFATYREFAGGKEQLRIFQDREEAMRWLLEG